MSTQPSKQNDGTSNYLDIDGAFDDQSELVGQELSKAIAATAQNASTPRSAGACVVGIMERAAMVDNKLGYVISIGADTEGFLLMEDCVGLVGRLSETSSRFLVTVLVKPTGEMIGGRYIRLIRGLAD